MAPEREIFRIPSIAHQGRGPQPRDPSIWVESTEAPDERRMTDDLLNRALLPGNTCFGCGHENEHGLRIEVRRGGAADHLIARLDPPAHASGFPGLTHGGVLFTAMDCLATWVVALLREGPKSYWLLGGANISYRKAAPVGRPLELTGRLVAPKPESRVVVVRVEARDAGGDLVAEGEFREVPVAPEKFRRLAGINEVPPGWRALFEET